MRNTSACARLSCVRKSVNPPPRLRARTQRNSADSNLAALPERITNSAAKAAKALTKDAVIDLLLKKERAAVTAASRHGSHRAPISVSIDDDDDDTLERARASDSLDREGAARAYALRRAELRQQSFHDLAGTVPPEDVPAACVRAAAAVTHVMHQHFLLLQWHRTPLDARNGLGEYEWLHRCSLSEAEPPGGDEPAQVTAPRRSKEDASLIATLADLRVVSSILRYLLCVFFYARENITPAPLLHSFFSAAGPSSGSTCSSVFLGSSLGPPPSRACPSPSTGSRSAS